MSDDESPGTPDETPMTSEDDSGGLLGVIVTLGVIGVAIIFGNDGTNR